MHRSPTLALSILFLSLPVLSSAGDLTPDEQAFFDQHKADFVRFEPQKLDDLALEKVFSAPFYTVKVIIKIADGEPMTSFNVARVGDDFVSMQRPGEDGDLPDFQKLLSPEFKLRTPADAKAMQQALNVLYPPMMESDKKLISFRRTGNRWIFVRGQFFDSKSGYIFETGEDGEIKSVKYQLKLP